MAESPAPKRKKGGKGGRGKGSGSDVPDVGYKDEVRNTEYYLQVEETNTVVNSHPKFTNMCDKNPVGITAGKGKMSGYKAL